MVEKVRIDLWLTSNNKKNGVGDSQGILSNATPLIEIGEHDIEELVGMA